jgi:hypothetical protein
MNKKAEALDKFFADNKITCFQKEELNEKASPVHTVIYRAHMEEKGDSLPTMVVVDDTIYTMIQVLVSHGKVTEENKALVIEHLNAMNKRFKVFKYYVDDANNICLDSCIASTPEGFEPQMVQIVLDVILRHLNDEYAGLMAKIWGN